MFGRRSSRQSRTAFPSRGIYVNSATVSTDARAVICRALNEPVVVERITVESPKRGEVMLKLAACGVCHSDLSATNGTISMQLPLILGHEAAGEVVQVGEGV